MSMLLTPATSAKQAEKAFNLKMGKPFFVMDGLSLTAVNGFEAPMVRLQTNEGTDILMNERAANVFMRAFSTAQDWCELGWTDGMS